MARNASSPTTRIVRPKSLTLRLMPRRSASACGRAWSGRISPASGSCWNCSSTASSSPTKRWRSATSSPSDRRVSATRFVYCEGSIRVGCWDRPYCSQEPGFRGTWLGGPLERSSPAEIVRQVARRDAVEATHPALQPAVVRVHVLDVEGALTDADAGREVDRLVVQPALGGEGRVGLGTVRAEDGVAGDHGPERRGDGVGPQAGQHGVGGVAGAVAGDQRRDLLGREAPLARPLAAAAGAPLERTCGAAPSARPLLGAPKKVSSASTTPPRASRAAA